MISKPTTNLFNPDWLLQEAEIEPVEQETDAQQPLAMGRGAAWFVKYNQQHWVLKHYRRGGMVAKWNKEFYLGAMLSSTRAWQEWYLLNSLHSLGLPVPRPVAACVSWPFSRVSGLYKASIIINRIPHAMTLAEKCQDQAMTTEMWQSVGRCIARFHFHGVYHADLNANNILFDQDDKVYLIDFDKGKIKPAGTWEQENLSRLNRSLLKLKGLHDGFGFSEENWNVLLEAYKD